MRAYIDGRYRYWLKRDLLSPFADGEQVCWVMLNPSTADGTQDDPTIRKVIGFSSRWDFEKLVVVNLYAFRATDPRHLSGLEQDVGPENDRWIYDHAKASQKVIVAWGAHPTAVRRVPDVMALLKEAGHPQPMCLGVCSNGQPRHPLMLAYDTPLRPWWIE